MRGNPQKVPARSGSMVFERPSPLRVGAENRGRPDQPKGRRYPKGLAENWQRGATHQEADRKKTQDHITFGGRGETGRRGGLKIPCCESSVPVRLRAALLTSLETNVYDPSEVTRSRYTALPGTLDLLSQQPMYGGRRPSRSFPRRRVRVRIVTPRGSSLTNDLGPGGFCTSLMRVLPVDSRFEGTIHHDGRDERFTGRVVWARPGNPRLGIAGMVGVRFESIPPDLVRGIAAACLPPAAS
jgi:hypothetical protein